MVEINSDPIILTTEANGSGHWSVTPVVDIPAGDHTVTLIATLNGTSSTVSCVLKIFSCLPATGTNGVLVGIIGASLSLVGFAGYQVARRILRNWVPELSNFNR